MGQVTSIVRQRVTEIVAENWRQLVREVADARNLHPEDIDRFGERLWFTEWPDRIDRMAHMEDLGLRLTALGFLETRAQTMTADQIRRAWAILARPIQTDEWGAMLSSTPTLTLERRIEHGDPEVLLPKSIPPVPESYSSLVEAELTRTADNALAVQPRVQRVARLADLAGSSVITGHDHIAALISEASARTPYKPQCPAPSPVASKKRSSRCRGRAAGVVWVIALVIYAYMLKSGFMEEFRWGAPMLAVNTLEFWSAAVIIWFTVRLTLDLGLD